MSITVVEAVYQNGVLRLAKPIDLAEGTRVEVVVTPKAVEQPSSRNVNEILDELTSLARVEHVPTQVGRDHDTHLYGEGDAQ
ncbi:antitoxin family protein [Tautonia rosea]|uniref:antitoxin family protein n=1 Tax=Tautonia rosea TaxID=2728037 RepID=UPI0014735889|nr:antitoxin family protein [Tautonia rosea]